MDKSSWTLKYKQAVRMPTLMRASVLGQAKKPAVPILLHKNLNCSSFSIGFIERALTPRNNSILPDDSTFSPNLLSSVSPVPPSSQAAPFTLTLHHCHKKITLYLPGPAALPWCPKAAADTDQMVLTQVPWLTSHIYTGVTRRKERISIQSQWEIPCMDKDKFQG